jgi:hypothetical protein
MPPEVVDIPNISSLTLDSSLSAAWSSVETTSANMLQTKEMQSVPSILNTKPYYFDVTCNLNGDKCNSNYYYQSNDVTWVYDDSFLLLERPIACCDCNPKDFLNHYFNNTYNIF